MPRNSSGTYTLPVAAFVSGTVIKSADMNSDLSDIATALTQSLATTGVSAMSAPLPFFAGTVAAPGLVPSSDKTTGIYAPAVGSLAIGTAGAVALTFNSDQTTSFPKVATFTLGLTIGASGTAALAGTTNISNILVITSSVAFNTSTFTFGSSANANALIAAMSMFYTLTFTIDGGGVVPTTGAKGFLEIPCNSTITRVTILADQSGSAVVDISKSSYAGFPPSVSICASAKPTLSTAQKNQDSTLTGWTTSCSSGDILGFNLNSVTTCTRIQISLYLKRLAQ